MDINTEAALKAAVEAFINCITYSLQQDIKKLVDRLDSIDARLRLLPSEEALKKLHDVDEHLDERIERVIENHGFQDIFNEYMEKYDLTEDIEHALNDMDLTDRVKDIVRDNLQFTVEVS